MSEFVHTEQHGKVLLLQITYEKTLNCLNHDILTEMVDILRDYARNTELRALVLTGCGRSFCTGADLKSFTELETEGCVDYCMDYEEDIFHILSSSRKPTIAAVNGYALGGGCEIAMACDIRIAAENAVFGQPECGLGILPGFGGTQRLARLVGKGRAKELIFTCDRIDAQEAYRIGIVNKVVPQAELLDACRAMARRILKNGGYAVTLAKQAINAGLDTDLANGLKMEADAFALSFSTHDKKEGMTAFLEKRPAELTDF